MMEKMKLVFKDNYLGILPPTAIFHSALLVILLKLPYQISLQSNMFGETILTIRNNVLGSK